MIAGHFGLAALVKARELDTPLWALMLATVWLDIVFVPLLLLGVETLEPVGPGGYGAQIIHADFTHSVVGVAVLSSLFGWAAASRWGRHIGVVLALVVASHWVLDLLVHRHDMPLLPGNWLGLPRLGFGLWRQPMVAASLEALLVIGGAWAYWRAARKVAYGAGSGMRTARATSLLIAVAGLAILLLDVTSLA